MFPQLPVTISTAWVRCGLVLKNGKSEIKDITVLDCKAFLLTQVLTVLAHCRVFVR